MEKEFFLRIMILMPKVAFFSLLVPNKFETGIDYSEIKK